jgi:antirestriction protein ArdC
MRPEIKYGGDRAFYSPILDYVALPNKTAFTSPEEYYGTLFHELGHATGHANRLARKSILEPSYFGSHEYSKEELISECCSAFVSGHAGIENKTIENSAAYIQGWLKALKNDKTLLVQAAAQGHKAADYILNKQPEEMEESQSFQ